MKSTGTSRTMEWNGGNGCGHAHTASGVQGDKDGGVGTAHTDRFCLERACRRERSTRTRWVGQGDPSHGKGRREACACRGLSVPVH
eukprot:scaffold306468_cov36-Tisochrysis_lutea.AAC.1